MTTIRAFTEDLVNEWCLGQPKYINREAICKDIRVIMRKYAKIVHDVIASHRKMTNRELMKMGFEVQSILVVIGPEYTNDHGLNMQIDDMDIEVQGLIEEFFKKRFNVKSFVDYGA